MTERTGKCLCGAVTFKITAEPIFARICWCRDCQHIASNGSVNILVPAESLAIHGKVASHSSKADSGNEMTRQFCPECGCHLFGLNAARPQIRMVRVGNLDNPSSITPSQNIWVVSAPKWACLDAAMERVERQPVPPVMTKN
ncbi:MAG: GFA family protein [Alphaproteobacteria bacterium]|nr:GFA family protein [Alphaproteobacteria bacterium]